MSPRTSSYRETPGRFARIRLVTASFAIAIAVGCGRDDSARSDSARSDSTVVDEASTPSERGDEDNDRSDDSTILVVGDSLAAGYGLGDIALAWPFVLERMLREDGADVSVINGAESGRTTAGGASAIDWYLRRPVDVLIVALGGNDALRGIRVEAVEKNLETMVTKTLAKNPGCRVVITGMRAPPSQGIDYCSEFEAVFVRVADRHRAALVPFLLDGVAAEPGLNQRDGIHPTAEGQQILAKNVFRTLAPLLRD